MIHRRHQHSNRPQHLCRLHITGRSYIDERGSHTNLYLAALAPTGMGKDEPRVVNKELAAAAGIPKFVYGALNRKALENGLLGRCLFIETNDFQPLGEMSAAKLPRTLVETAAKEKLRELRFNADEISRRLFESDLETAAALYCRLYEKAVKLAVLYAASENPEAPRMSADAVRWAAAFATHVTKKMLYESQFNLAEGQVDRLKKRFVGLLAKIPSK